MPRVQLLCVPLVSHASESPPALRDLQELLIWVSAQMAAHIPTLVFILHRSHSVPLPRYAMRDWISGRLAILHCLREKQKKSEPSLDLCTGLLELRARSAPSVHSHDSELKGVILRIIRALLD